LLLEPRNGGTRYTAIAIHGDEATRKQHEEMGFHDGWGTVVTQMTDYIKAGMKPA
ncbi:MAG: SRPBCC domain-containing protein, partial [Xanthobacteraceae bacterium]|nr:SRPBCC domain-containing protein [Xanthobacteraceae bacterium]